MRMIPYEQEPGRERSAPYYREQERRRNGRDPLREDMYNRGGNYARTRSDYGMSRRSRSAMDNRMRMGRIGFEYDDGYSMRGGRGGTYMHGNGGSHGDYEMGHGHSEDRGGLSYDEAEEWVRSMKNADGSKGGKWKMEKLEGILHERGIKCDVIDIYAGMNALYSDLGKVMEKYYGVTDKDVNFWLEAAIAFWIEDEDAVEDKLAVYYDCIVE